MLKQDYVVVGSDSGRIVILEYNATKNSFDRVHMETFGEWTVNLSTARLLSTMKYLFHHQ